MACVSGDGKLTKSAKALLEALSSEKQSAESLAKELGAPLFKIRSSIREMVTMGFVEQVEETYQITEAVENALNEN